MTALLASSTDAMAQSLRHYRLVDIGVIAPNDSSRNLLDMQEQQGSIAGFAAIDRHQNFMGMNAYGEVVGGMVLGTTGPVHAFVWLPVARHSLASGLHDLQVLAHGSSDTDWSFANDINDAGVVVGQKGVNVTDTCLARRWTLGSTITTATLHTTTGDFSAASDVNDASPAVVVGETSVECENAAVARYHRAFVRSVDPLDSMTLLGLLADKPASRAYAVRDATSQVIVGANAGKVIPAVCDYEGPQIDQCANPIVQALAWTSSTPTVLTSLSGDPMNSWGAEAHGLNESSDAVGFGWIVPSESSAEEAVLCPYHAVYWEGGTTTPVDLGLVLDPTTPPRSRANDVTERDLGGCVTVVGADLDGIVGTIWYGQGSSDWCSADLNDLTFSTCVPPNGRVIERAWAVNNRRHVTVEFRQFKSGTLDIEYRAGILTDIADLNGDLRVNYTDLCILYASFTVNPSGTCDSHPEADLNCDGVVDAADSGVLFARWSGDGVVGIRPICLCEPGDSLLGPEAIAMAVAEAIELLGFALTEFDSWARTATIGEVDAAGHFIEEWVTLTTGQEGQS